ncbi:enoyl-CoA hydratase/isomerase family protein [Caldovatus aquaticus]|uniref:Enoyl-CoA hydratase/isomerase family protein n=1 Tax=Caldovatus aquaticus TaxID=2865671 RepID=A0ABS7F6I6_9PROT|nr:enoyl-CoA hydratase-related protein [Caldovatus aquaticus]MBW8270426.1 enoyl-CoA hydratase/isomerase family protein [Caldovatus aquaticus]
MAGSPVLTSREQGGIVRIRLNRPAVLNALDQAMVEALHAAVGALAGDPSVRCVVLSGEGRGFMAGGDIGLFRAAGREAPAVIGRLIEPFHAALRLLAALPAPVIASLHGPVAGGGMSLALATDLAIAAEDTRFALAYLRLGVSPDGGGTWALPRLVGLRRAMGIALLGEELDARAALDLGLVNRVVPNERLEAETMAIARRLAAGPAQAIARTKALLRASLGRDLAAQLDAERDAFLACAGTADFAEGVAAFLERRAPSFTGR